MKKMTKRTLSLVLVIALVFSLGVTALAENIAATDLTISDTSATVYVGGTKTLTAVKTPSDSSYPVIWSSSDEAKATVNNGVVTGVAVGSATITAKVQSNTDDTNPTYIEKTCAVTVSEDTVTVFSVTAPGAANKSVTMTIGSNLQLTGTTSYVSGKTTTGLNVTKNTDNTVANNTSAGLITAANIGQTTITAASPVDGSKTDTITVNVVADFTVTATAPTTKNLLAGSSVTMEVTTTAGSSATYQWYKGNAAISNATAAAYTISTAATSDSGNYTCKVTDNGITKSSDTFTVNVRAPYTVTITGGNSVTVGSSINLTATVINNTVVNNAFSTSAAAGTVSWSSAATKTLTVSPASATLSSSAASTTATGVAAGSSVVTASYTAGGQTYTGTVTVTVNAGAAIKLAKTLTDLNEFTLADLNSSLISGIRSAAGLNLFTSDATIANGTTITFYPQTATYGTLYTDSSYNALSTYAQYYNCASSTSTANTNVYHYFHNMYFVPAQTTTGGNYSISFIAYYGGVNYTGTLTITVPKMETTYNSLTYNVTAKGSVAMADADFSTWYNNQFTTTTKPDLAYVVFAGQPTSGTLKHSITNISTSTNYYTADYVTGSNKLLSDVKYTAPSSTGCYSVNFTAYGKNGSYAKAGTLYFCVVKGTVNDISYNAAYGMDAALYESDFASVYTAATNSTATSPKFTVKFTQLPTMGTLYYAGKTTSGYKVTTSNNFNVNYTSTSSTYDLDYVTYVPGKYSTGTDTATYAVYDTNSTKPVYVGTVKFVYTVANSAITCYAEGHGFSSGDFTAPSASDPISYVQFTGVSTGGKLFYNYANGAGTAVTTAQKFYASTAVTGALPLNKVTFISKAGQVAAVSVGYTAVTKAGKTVSGTLTMNMATRATALKFSDVNAAWAVGSVDYVSTWGLMDGVGSGKFNPNGTMTRAMLVTIIYRMAGSPSFTGLANPFTDVSNSSSNWYRNAVVWAYNKGIVTGTSKTTFSPNSAVSRQDIASMLWRYAGEPSGYAGYISGYPDASNVASYAQSAMGWAVASGIITGNGGRLLPTANGSRAEVSVMLHRYLTSF